MNLLFEFLPLALFFIAFIYKGIYTALVVLMIAMPIGLIAKYIRTGVLDKMYFWSTVMLLIAGGFTLYFRNPLFLYWKPTVFYWLVAVAFLGSQFLQCRDQRGEMLPNQATSRVGRGDFDKEQGESKPGRGTQDSRDHGRLFLWHANVDSTVVESIASFRLWEVGLFRFDKSVRSLSAAGVRKAGKPTDPKAAVCGEGDLPDPDGGK